MCSPTLAGAQRHHADLLARALARQSLAAVHADLAEVAAQRLGDDLGHADGGPAGRVLLEAVVGLRDLDVVVVAEGAGHEREQLEAR